MLPGGWGGETRDRSSRGPLGPAREPGAGRGGAWRAWAGPSPGRAGRGGGRRGQRLGAGRGAARRVPACASPSAPRTPLSAGEDGRARLRGPRARAALAAPGLLVLLLLLLLGLVPGVQAARGRGGAEKNSYRRTVNTFSQSVSSLFGEDNVRAAQKFLTRMTERFVLGVDMFVETLWKVWVELLDVLGLDVSNMSQYFSPTSVSSSPTRALLLVGAVLLAYWFLSLALGFAFSLLHLLCGRFFWAVRVLLFSMSCVYILHKYEGEPESAVLPLCFVVALYFMTGPMGCHWRSSPGGPGVEEKLEHLENQVRLLNVRLNRVLETLDRAKDK